MKNTNAGKPLKGAEIVASCLEKIGVEVVFAYPGGQTIELHQAMKNRKFRVVLPQTQPLFLRHPRPLFLRQLTSSRLNQ